MGEDSKLAKDIKVKEETTSTTPNKGFVPGPFAIYLMINDNVVRPYYFSVPDFRVDSLECVELKQVLDKVVQNIQSDLEYKSRIYQYYTADGPVKMTGFLNELPGGIEKEDRVSAVIKLTSDKHRGEVVLPNGQVIKKEYLEYPPFEDKYGDYDRPADGEVMMKFVFAYRGKPVYVRQWDGNVYPKFVRHSIDLSNSDETYKDFDPNSLTFVLSMNKRMNEGRPNLIKQAVEMISGILDKSNLPKDSEGEFTRYDYYCTPVEESVLPKKEGVDKGVKPIEILGHIEIPIEEREYFCSTYNKPCVDAWGRCVSDKTRKYERWRNHEYPNWLLEKIDRMVGRGR